MTQTVLFYVYAAVAVAGALGLVLAPRLVHAVLSLFATLVSVAAIYLLLGSEFLAAMQLFVYGGAITVLVLFVLMLARPEAEHLSRTHRGMVATAGALCLGLLGWLAVTVGTAAFPASRSIVSISAGSLAEVLFSRYVIPFEIAGLALTIALLGSIVLAREDDMLEDAEDAETGSGVEADAAAIEEGGESC